MSHSFDRKSAPVFRAGFTLIELLIVIAIILILIAIALPNFLEAQVRAKVTRERADLRTMATAIESLRADRRVLLVDFWDDDNFQIINQRFRQSALSPSPTFYACCRWHGGDYRGGTTGIFTPLTTPVAYIQTVPPDPFFDSHDVGNLIDQDVLQPVSYMYLDREAEDMRLGAGDFTGAFGCWRTNAHPDHCTEATRNIEYLRQDSFVVVGLGPDGIRQSPYTTHYAPTNGTTSFGDVLYRSDLQFSGK